MPPTIGDEDDTIVVKGEFESHPSSPESSSPEIDPLASKPLLKDLESPEPYQDTVGSNISTTRQDRVTSRRPKANITTMEDRLQHMPELRPLPWRPGVEEGADVETGGESRRKQIRFGCLLASRGVVQEPGCHSCVNGRGKFSLCIALDGYFKGACASCQLSGRPNRCSIKKEDDLISSSAVGTPDGDNSFNQGQAATSSNDTRPSGPPRKRRRTSEVKRANEAKRASMNDVPQWAPQPPPQSQHYQPIPLGKQPPPLSPQSPQLNVAPLKAWAAVNQPQLKPQLLGNGSDGNRILAQEQYRPKTTGWATVNQPHQQPQARAPTQPQIYPLQPASAPPVQQPLHNGGEIQGNGFHVKGERERRESSNGNEEGSGALIDSLSKGKQRQLYGLISGLQGGIDHLQRELDALKKAIGIDDEN